MTAYDYSVLSDTEVEELFRSHLDMADENDDEGGHVGISRHHRRQANRYADEIQRRGREQPGAALVSHLRLVDALEQAREPEGRRRPPSRTCSSAVTAETHSPRTPPSSEARSGSVAAALLNWFFARPKRTPW